jgi:hypothetical protein
MDVGIVHTDNSWSHLSKIGIRVLTARQIYWLAVPRIGGKTTEKSHAGNMPRMGYVTDRMEHFV